MIKQFIIVLLVCLSTNRIFCQAPLNHTYDHNGISEFAKHVLNYKNAFLVLSNMKTQRFTPPSGILIRVINENGNLIWSDFYKDENDSLNYYVEGSDNVILLKDSLLFAFGQAQDKNLDSTPTFFKYDLTKRKVVDFKLYNSEFGGVFKTAQLHSDGYFYAGNKIYKNRAYTEYDILLMKIDKNGEVIWQKEFAFGGREDITDIESYGDLLLCAGRTVQGELGTQVYLLKVDTYGNEIQFKTFFEFGDVGNTQIEVDNNDIYFTSNSQVELVNEETTYLGRLDGDFNVVWDTLIASSSKYDLRTQEMIIANDAITIIGGINPSYQYTNWKKWVYATSWSVDGELNWEHRYIYKPDFLHYLNDVISLPNGDLLFMGTLMGFFVEDSFNQNLWLFRTDSDGCGIIQDTCLHTLDAYFGLDTIVNVFDYAEIEHNGVQILGNPFANELVLQVTGKQLNISIYNIQGHLVYEDLTNGTLSLNTTNWQSGVYLLQVMDESKLLAVKKMLRELARLNFSNTNTLYKKPIFALSKIKYTIYLT